MRGGEGRARLLLGILVFVAVLAAFAPALDNGFVGWDDTPYLLANESFRGLGAAQLRWMLTTTRFGWYQPLTWLSFGVDYALWGLQPWGFHLTNVLLHAVTSVMFFAICLRLFKAAGLSEGGCSGAPLAAAAAALAFAVHPLRVESVAWAVERRDVLSGAFWVGSLLCAMRAVTDSSRRSLMPALVLFALALLSKPSGLGLPVALLVLDVYPLRRLPADARCWGQPAYRAVWAEKAYFMALSVAASALAFWTLRRSGELHGLAERGLAWRLDQAFYGLWLYALKTLWPTSLLPYYPPRPWFGAWAPALVLLAGIALAAAAAWALRRRAPAVPAAAAAYAALAAPMLGAMQNGIPYSACDRYSYLPSLALSALFGAGVGALTRRQLAWGLAAALPLAALGTLAWRQTRLWCDSLTLWGYAVAAEPGCAVALNNLGVAVAESGRLDEARTLFARAVCVDPAYADARENLAAAFARAGRNAEAERELRRVLALRPSSASARRRLGRLLSQGRDARLIEAEGFLREAADGGEPQARAELAAVLAARGRLPQAVRAYEAAVAADPADGASLNNLGLLLDGLGRREEARARYRQALRDQTARALAHYNWGNSLMEGGRGELAERHYAQALRLDPGFAKAEVNWGNVLVRSGRFAQAAAHYRAALKKAPDSVQARANLSAVLRASAARRTRR